MSIIPNNHRGIKFNKVALKTEWGLTMPKQPEPMSRKLKIHYEEPVVYDEQYQVPPYDIPEETKQLVNLWRLQNVEGIDNE